MTAGGDQGERLTEIERDMTDLRIRMKELVMLLRVLVVIVAGNFAGHILEYLHPL